MTYVRDTLIHSGHKEFRYLKAGVNPYIRLEIDVQFALFRRVGADEKAQC